MGAISVGPKDDHRVNSAHVDQETTDPSSRRRPLDRLRRPRRPRIWFELLLIAVSYTVYSYIRNAVPEQVEAAQRHAHQIWDLQQAMGLDFELAVNHAVNDVTWLIVGVNYFYATLHFVVTIGVLVWLFRSHPGRYGATRLVLFATTAVALVGYYFYPLAPPRLMEGMDFIDTGLVHQTWGSLSSESMQNVSNQYAAMPSMHIGWSLWCGLTIAVLARRRWLKVLGALYPVATLFVIVATANHFWLDAVGGLVCLGFGFLVSALWFGSLCYRLPRHIAVEQAAAAAGAGSTVPAPAGPRGGPGDAEGEEPGPDGDGGPPGGGGSGGDGPAGDGRAVGGDGDAARAPDGEGPAERRLPGDGELPRQQRPAQLPAGARRSG
ncbi:phosphatase PAP2 family protein [Streptomyces bohaiensis]|uniref:Phosphatase PAP2 family protein n=1 Tax=Streptomyces bohaiensis TaxID=1431344 RepID=A0ABX1C9P4_9ACTN|nr:phosphatase PAP2 family protein [Streptomyces bohaiensis]